MYIFHFIETISVMQIFYSRSRLSTFTYIFHNFFYKCIFAALSVAETEFSTHSCLLEVCEIQSERSITRLIIIDLISTKLHFSVLIFS